jgi:putative transposase
MLSTAPQPNRTFFVTSVTDGRRALLQSERMAHLLLDVLYSYRSQGRYLLHEFVVMPNHFHLLITPAIGVSLEKLYSSSREDFRIARERSYISTPQSWEAGFTNHRICDSEDYQRRRAYIRANPVKANLVESAEMYPYSSAVPGMELDAAPPGLKPAHREEAVRGS